MSMSKHKIGRVLRNYLEERSVGRREDMPVGVKFSIISRAFKSRIDDLMRDYGLTSVQAGVILALNRFERCGKTDEVNQKDLEQAMGLTHQTMTEIIKKLEANGFVKCSQSTKDKRSKSIKTTDKVGEIHKNMDKTDNMVLEEMCKGIGDDKKKELISMLDVMLDNIFEKEGK